MRTPEELFGGPRYTTSLQRDEHLRKLRGEEFELVGELSDITPDRVRCDKFFPDLASPESIRIDHRGDELKTRLLDYSDGDVVRMTLRFTGFNSSGHYDRWSFSLVSIDRLQTREAKKEREAAIGRLDSALDSLGPITAFYYFYLLPALSNGTVVVRTLIENHERIRITLGSLVGVALMLAPIVNWLTCLFLLWIADGAQRRLLFSVLAGWAIVGGMVALTVFLVLQIRRWSLTND